MAAAEVSDGKGAVSPTSTGARYHLFRLSPEDRQQLLEDLAERRPREVADLLRHLEDAEAAEFLSELPPRSVARVIERMASNDRADVLERLPPVTVRRVLDQLDSAQAANLRAQLSYPPDTAGGLMITEVLSFLDEWRVQQVIDDLRANREAYAQYEVRYIYTVDDAGCFRGQLELRSMLLTDPQARLSEVGRKEVSAVPADTPEDELEPLLEATHESALPVVDSAGKLVGAVTRAAVEEAQKEEQANMLLKFGGIVAGEEVRSTSALSRAARRMAFLLPTVVLSALAVTIIAAFEPLVERISALAVALPLVANLTGAAGNQAVAVSIRELSLGVVRPGDVLAVWRNELWVGLLQGSVVGVLLLLLVWFARGELLLGANVGAAFLVACVLAVLAGGGLPLALERMGVDPAMLSSPILNTFTDMAAFALTLGLAALLLYQGLYQ